MAIMKILDVALLIQSPILAKESPKENAPKSSSNTLSSLSMPDKQWWMKINKYKKIKGYFNIKFLILII
jgi:hypothetical protein